MQAILTFALDGEEGREERERLDLCLHAEAMSAVLHDLDEHLRQRAKYGTLPEAALDEVEALRRWLLDEIRDRAIPWE
jgi:hypothetical protein